MKKTYCHQQACRGFVGTIGFWLLFIALQIFLIIYLSRQMDFWGALQANFKKFYSILENHRLGLMVALLIAPTFGVPISLLWILAGAFWGVKVGLFICFICIGINLVFSYFFYKKCLNKFLFRSIFKNQEIRKINLTSKARLTSIKWVFLIQLIPHIPYIAQCYILATLNEVNFWHYLSISWIFQSLWAWGFICGGNALKTGQWGITIFLILLIAIFLTRKCYYFFKKLDKSSC